MFRYAAAALALLTLTACDPQDQGYTFGVSAPSGPYEMAARNLVRVSSENSLPYTFRIRNTLGSSACIRLINENFLKFAIVQSDVMSDALHSRKSFVDYDNVSYGVIADLFNESAQIVVPAASRITRIQDLLNKRVSVGELGTGTRHDALRILKYHGLSPELVRTFNYPSDLAVAELKAGRLDAMFLTDIVPSPVFSKLADDADIRFLRLEPYVLQTMVRRRHGHLIGEIPPHTYRGQTAAVPVLGCRVLLIARKDVASDTVFDLTRLIDEKISKNSMDSLRLGSGGSPDNILDLPYHPGAVRYYTEQGINPAVFTKTPENNG